jgi:hypothetical protein
VSAVLCAAAAVLASCGGGGQRGIVIVAAGDISCASSDCARATANLFTGTSARVDPALVLALGDNQYECGSPSKFKSRYDSTWGRRKSITWAVPGNHEYYTSLRYAAERDCAGQSVGPNAAGGFFHYFGAAANSPGQATCVASCDGWYFHDLDANGDGTSDWRLIALNTGRCGENPIFSPKCSPGSSQETWLRTLALKRPPACILAYWHHPRYTSDTSVHKDNAATDQFWRDLYAARADLVVNGHVHDYQRSVPLEPYGSGRRDDVHGIVEFVVGTGGAGLRSFDPPQPNSLVRSNVAHGVLELVLHQSSYDFDFVSVGGAFDDRGSGDCH